MIETKDLIEHITDQEMEKLMTTKSATEWRDTCDEIKRARNGQYPKDWHERIVMSGCMESRQTTWEMFSMFTK